MSCPFVVSFHLATMNTENLGHGEHQENSGHGEHQEH